MQGGTKTYSEKEMMCNKAFLLSGIATDRQTCCRTLELYHI